MAFGGVADQPWLRLLRPGFRHCFAALSDEAGWTVLEPLSGRLMVARLPVAAGFDLPGFYRRAGLRVLGPFLPGEPAASRGPALMPFTCVSLCRALLGPGTPFAVTPFGLFRALGGQVTEVASRRNFGEIGINS
ncbi:MAG: diiron oxygenase [Roseomonas sp.]|nr:diiron oxygenase [Roseomonas sp.]